MVETGPKYRLVLYVSGQTPISEQAISNVCRLLDDENISGYDLQIIDVLESPELAESERIIATPALVRKLPEPRDILIGDFSHATSLRGFLGIPAAAGETT